MNWLFERNVFDDGNPEKMLEIARSRGMTGVEVGFHSASGDDRQLRPEKPVPFAPDDPVFVYGSINLCRWLLERGKWPKLAWYDFERLRCRNYYAHWGPFLLQREHMFLPLAEVRRQRDRLFEAFGADGRLFIRPDDNAKSFAGGVVEASEFETWWELANFYHPGPECLAVVARPQTIRAEWRFVVGNRNVIAGSQYRRDGAEAIVAGFPDDAATFAAMVANANAFDPHPVYVMDVCQTDDGFRLIEIGSVCCASLYCCDLEKVVAAVAGATESHPS